MWADSSRIIHCIDRHLNGPRKNKAAIIWEGEPGDWQVYTYRDLYREVCKFANGLKSLGVQKGYRVTLYLPMVPELADSDAGLRCIGAPHSIVFGGFSAESLRDRLEDSQSKVMITADGGWRRATSFRSRPTPMRRWRAETPVEKVVVVRRTGHADDQMQEGRDVWWHDLVADQPLTCDPEPMDSEDMLFMLYTSGTTGKPKGIVHTTGGYMTGTYATTKWIFDLKEDDVYWCTADIGWVTGHSYFIYGPLANGATTVKYEGSPDYPTGTGSGPSSRNTAAPFATPLPRPSARSCAGRGVSGASRHVVAAAAGLGGRTHQPGGVGLVLAAHRRRPVSRGGYVVADRNRLGADYAPARHHHAETRLGDAAVSRHRCRYPR